MPKHTPSATIITKHMSNADRKAHFDKNISTIVKLRRSGLSTYEICKTTGFAPETLKRWLEKVGEYKPQWVPVSHEQRGAIVEMYLLGHPIPYIADRVGMHVSTVQGIAKAEGVRRTRSESQVVRAARDPSVGKMFGNPCAFYSIKQAKWFYAGSGYEYVRMEMLDLDPDVVMWRRCEDRIPYELDGMKRLYNPDLDVVRSDGSFVVEEIKPLKMTTTPRNVAKFEAAMRFYHGTGKSLIFITEKDIGGRDAIRKLDGVCLSGMPIEERKLRIKSSVKRCRDKKAAVVTPVLPASTTGNFGNDRQPSSI